MKNTRLHRFQKQITQIILALLFTVSCSLFTANAAVPHLINYQGRLTDSSGTPLNGTYDLTFRIYDAEAAGNLLWQETHSAVLIQRGIFSIMLGSVADLNLPFDKTYFLEIKIGNEVMSPRQQLTSAGYAVRAETAEQAIQANQANNANTVANVAVSATPAANKILPLDSNAKLPVAALKTYDSGWFNVSYSDFNSRQVFATLTHNLGTTKVLIQVLAATLSGGGGTVFGIGFYHDMRPGSDRDSLQSILTTTQISIVGRGPALSVAGAEDTFAQSLRVIMLALE